MRWFWIDRFLEFESGRRAVTIKSVSLIEEPMLGYVPGFPVYPPVLIIEGLAQTGGLLVGQNSDFQKRVVLAKVARATFHAPVVAGDTLTLTAVAEDIQEHGAICQGTCHVGSELRAEVQLVFAHLGEGVFEGLDQFEPADFLRTLRVLRLFEVGRTKDGGPLQIPPHMLEAEAAESPAS